MFFCFPLHLIQHFPLGFVLILRISFQIFNLSLSLSLIIISSFFLFLPFSFSYFYSLNWLIYSHSHSHSLSLSLILIHSFTLSLLSSRDRIITSQHILLVRIPKLHILSFALSPCRKKGTNWRKSRPNCIIFSFIYYGWNFVSQYIIFFISFLSPPSSRDEPHGGFGPLNRQCREC